ncbi:hypothetical protein GCM10023196_059630 [Actinoallomurus vinaceus]|uniref:PPE family domain-containing protein n=1 Tax=Actinoallomurus vinaceus TaxID=1080074 RepID=A0ABP8UFW6_9ACTN
MASALWIAYRQSLEHASAVFMAVAGNLATAAGRLEENAANYRDHERVIEAAIAELGRDFAQGWGGREMHEWQKVTSTERWVPRSGDPAESTIPDLPLPGSDVALPSRHMRGILTSSVALPGSEPPFLHVEEIAERLRVLQRTPAWAEHYSLSMMSRGMADHLDSLGLEIYRVAVELSRSWSGTAAAAAQTALWRIEGTVRSLGGFARSLSTTAEESGKAIEEIVAPIQLKGLLKLFPSGRANAVTDAFDRLNERYRQVDHRRPRTLAYDLPFGGLPVRLLGGSPPVSPRRPTPETSRPASPPFADGQTTLTPPVIGGSLQGPGTENWRSDPWFDDGAVPGVIG